MKMKMPKLLSRKKLRATVARRSLRASAETYDDMSEPNMKLSRALLIVLVLHIVAVSGIVAFNAIKTRQDSYVKVSDKAATPAPSAGLTSNLDKVAPKESPRPSNLTALSSQAPSHSSPKSTGKNEQKVDRATSDSGKTYVVVKGDNPVTIAKKLKVSYDELLDLNHISDPRKLQIGQKLLIPKPVKGKKTDE